MSVLLTNSPLFESILNNAIAYTKENGAISITLEKDAKNIYIKIMDDGTGIKKEDLPHNGSIKAESVEGQGSTFTVTLPLA